MWSKIKVWIDIVKELSKETNQPVVISKQAEQVRQIEDKIEDKIVPQYVYHSIMQHPDSKGVLSYFSDYIKYKLKINGFIFEATEEFCYREPDKYELKIYLSDDFAELLIYNSKLKTECNLNPFTEYGNWIEALYDTLKLIAEEVQLHKELMEEERQNQFREKQEEHEMIVNHFHNVYERREPDA